MTQTRKIAPALLVVAGLAFGSLAKAAHISTFGSIDALDGTAPAGGGMFSGFLSAPGDDDWVAFFATVGDNISVALTTTASFTDAAIFREVTNGIIDIGDAANVTNLNTDRTGAGTDLIIQHAGWTASGFYTFTNSGGVATLNYIISTTGWHVLGLTINNEDASRIGTWTANLTGNTGSPVSVPEPGTIVLLGLGLAGMGLARRRRGQTA